VNAQYCIAPENPRSIYIAHNGWIPLAVAQQNPVGVFFWSCKKILEYIHARYSAIQVSCGYFSNLSMEAPEYSITLILKRILKRSQKDNLYTPQN